MKRQPWQLMLAATLSLSCAGKHSQNVAPNNGMCENDNEILVAPDSRTHGQLEAEKQVMIRLGLLQPTDPAKLVAGGIVPEFANPKRLAQRIEKAYRPPGTTGIWTVQVIALVDAHGRVTAARIDSTSGRAALDSTALKIVRATAFKPAVHGGCHVRAQVAFPITFAEA
jgi:TonB family protein